MLEKVIYLMQVPISAREYSSFGAEFYQRRALDVEIWECTPFLNPTHGEVPRPAAFCKIKQFSSAKEVCAALQALGSETAAINLLPKNKLTLPIFKKLNASPLQSVEVRTNALPLPPRSAKKSLDKIFSGKLYSFLLRRPGVWSKLAGRPQRIIYGGAICRPLPEEALRRISAHALDYDAYTTYMSIMPGEAGPGRLKEAASGNLAAASPGVLAAASLQGSKEAGLCKGDKIVFLDQCLPFHSDFKVLQKASPVTEQEYYPALCKFFGELENKLGLPVVIAAHPRAPYSQTNDFFENRQVIKGQSLALVCGAALVLAHTSTALNFAVMARRPARIIATNQLLAAEQPTLDFIAKSLGTATLPIEALAPDWDADLLSFNSIAYETYFNRYIKEQGSPDLPFWEILLRDLRAVTLP